jgi:hypothetical protein
MLENFFLLTIVMLTLVFIWLKNPTKDGSNVDRLKVYQFVNFGNFTTLILKSFRLNVSYPLKAT